MSAQDDRIMWVTAQVKVIEGECARKDGTAWCSHHESFMSINQWRCRYVQDLDEFGERLIHDWEARARG